MVVRQLVAPGLELRPQHVVRGAELEFSPKVIARSPSLKTGNPLSPSNLYRMANASAVARYLT